MRKIILTAATAAVLGFAGPAFADMTLPAGAYAQTPAAAPFEAPAYYATVDRPARVFGGHTVHHGRLHRY